MAQCFDDTLFDIVSGPKAGLVQESRPTQRAGSVTESDPNFQTILRENDYNLLADVGGTNTRFGLALAGQLVFSTCKSYRNADYKSFDLVLARYLVHCGEADFDNCCIAVAATIKDGIAQLTNLDWMISTSAVENTFAIENVHLINDLEALGYALGCLDPNSTRIIFPAFHRNVTNKSKLVVGIGTGFNTATVHEIGPDTARVFPAESGYMALPAGNGIPESLRDFASAGRGFCSIEDILSGDGLEIIYRGISVPDAAPKGAAEICASLADGSDPCAEKAARLFVAALGGVIGDLALSHLPFGGIYLAGSVARSLSPYFKQFGFLEALRNKGRKSEVMLGFELFLLQDDFAALSGCVTYLTAKPSS